MSIYDYYCRYTDIVHVNVALCMHRVLVSELLEKDVVHEQRLKELWGDKVILYIYIYIPIIHYVKLQAAYYGFHIVVSATTH
jgi:hypothetical protein